MAIAPVCRKLDSDNKSLPVKRVPDVRQIENRLELIFSAGVGLDHVLNFRSGRRNDSQEDVRLCTAGNTSNE